MPEGFDLEFIEAVFADAEEVDTENDLVLVLNEGTDPIALEADPWPGMTTICGGESGGPFLRSRADALILDEDYDGEGGNAGPLSIVEMA